MEKSAHSAVDLEAVAEEAWLYVLPLLELAGARARGAAAGGRMNHFSSLRNLADHRARSVTTPNNDTLYSSAQLDLGAGPVILVIPPTGERYFSLALMDAYTNNFAILGTRTIGPEGGRFTLIGPEEAGSAGPYVIRSPTRHVWALARIMVAGTSDLEAARAVQAGLALEAPDAPQDEPPPGRRDDWRSYFAGADRLLANNPAPATDLALLRRIAPLKLGSGHFDPTGFSNAEQDAITRGAERARQRLFRGEHGTLVDGWSYPDGALGAFGQNYRFRAQVAVAGLAALPIEEAMYMRALGPDRGLYDGREGWCLRFPPNETPPVDAFWSLSLYEATEDGQFFFTDNPLGRYAIGDRTEGLRFAENGSLTLWIGHRRPDDDRLANWLPAPAGPFALFMRAYLPQPALLNGRYRLPPIEPA